MSLVAHAGADLINRWGFAYVGGVIGMFSLALLYVKAKVDQRTDSAGPNAWARAIASLGPVVILVGGVCGVSMGLGIAGVLDTTLGGDANLSDVLADLCDLRFTEPQEPRAALHDGVVHVIDDLDLAAAAPEHRALHAAAAAPEATVQDWVGSIDQLAASLAADGTAPERTCDVDVIAN